VEISRDIKEDRVKKEEESYTEQQLHQSGKGKGTKRVCRSQQRGQEKHQDRQDKKGLLYSSFISFIYRKP